MEKKGRQAAIARIIEAQPACSQNELVALLRKQGVRATQASISRDLRELGLVKVKGRYLVPDHLGRGEPQERIPGVPDELLVSVEPVGANLVVVRTKPGSANLVAVGFDERKPDGVAGTVAGDDTIFIAVRSRSVQGRTVALLRGAMRL
jgi:transcriptional regulator of arginine metabolism